MKSKKWLPLKICLRSVWDHVVLIPFAWLYYRLFILDRRYYDVIICPHIGDFLYSLGYMSAFEQQTDIKNIRIISCEKFKRLLTLYPQYHYPFLGITNRGMKLLLQANRYRFGQLLFTEMQSNLIIEPANAFVMGDSYATSYPDFTLRSCIKYGGFHLRKDSSFIFPTSRMPTSTIEVEHRSIVVCPFAQVTDQKQVQAVLTSLIPRLIEQGYEVIINGTPDAFKPDGVRYATWTLDEFFEVCKTIHAVIGIRSGILDLAAMADCRVLAIYPSGNAYTGFYDMNRMIPQNKYIYSYTLRDSASSDMKNLIRIIEKMKVSKTNEY